MAVGRSRRRARSHAMRAVTALVGTLALALSASAQGGPASTSAQGSSCAHPYRVFWLIPGKNIPNIDSGHKLPGEMDGDTNVIKVTAAYLGPPPSNALAAGRFKASWKPLVGGLKICLARITFTYRKPLISHQWHPHPVTVLYNTEAEYNHEALDRITSLVVKAAR
jgi:hypothetical protein